MNKLILALGLLSFVVLGSATSAHAKDEDFNDFHASRFAQLLERVQKPEDLYKVVPHTDKARELIKKDVDAKPGRVFDRAPIEMDGSTTVVIKGPGRDVRFEFSHFDEGYVTVEGKKIELTREKTFINYRNELEAALATKSARFSLFIEEAHAQGIRGAAKAFGDWMTNTGASIIYSLEPSWYTFKTKTNSPDASLEANIARAFEQDLKAQGPAFDPNTMVVDPEVGGYKTPTFNCSNGKLTQIARARPGARGGFTPVEDIFSRTATGWTFKSTPTSPALTLDKNFKVVGTSEGLAARNTNFLNHVQNPWRYFPQLAERCCARSGCHARVSAAVRPNLERSRSEDRAIRSQGGSADQ